MQSLHFYLPTGTIYPQGNDKTVQPHDTKESLQLFTLQFMKGQVVSIFPPRPRAPPKACFQAWQLQRKDFQEEHASKTILNGLNRSSLCFDDEEMVDHMLVYCQWVSSLSHLPIFLIGVH